MIDALLAKLRARGELDDEEESILRESVSGTETIGENVVVVHARQILNRSILLLEGIMCRQKLLADGGCQIAELSFAGDFIDLHGFTLRYLDHDVVSLTPSRVAYVPHERLVEITERHPRLTRKLWFLTNLDAAIHREWELSLGRRPAVSRLANLFCEFHVRLGVVGLADPKGYDLALTQSELAQCVGITLVHVNRSLRQLRDSGLAEFRGGRVHILDLARLRSVAEFDPGYLYLDRLPFETGER